MSDNGEYPARLDSWKAIADYLGRDVRTAMRWAKADGLPVRRVGDGRRRAVYAHREELDEWLSRGRALEMLAPAPVRGHVRRPWPWIGIGALAVVVLLFAAASQFGATAVPIARAALQGRDLVAFDARGREVWRSQVAREQERIGPPEPKLIRWDPTEPPQVLLAASIQRTPGDGSGSLRLFDSAGQLRWQRSLDAHYAFGGVDYGPTWYPDDVLTYRTGNDWRIATAFHHHTWWPSGVATFDRDGHMLATFVNSGWIRSLNVTTDGRYLLASGISNAFGGAMLAVLDAANINGTSPREGSTLPACSNCPAGAPVTYFVVPWSDVARPLDTPSVVVQVADSGQIELRAPQRTRIDGPLPEVIITWSPTFDALQRTVSDGFAEAHALLERQGLLGHPFARCPWRTPAVRKWTPAHGWEEIK